MKNRKNRPVNGKVFRSGVYSTAILAAAILLAVLVNLVVRALPSKYTEFDLSEGKMYTLGDSSVQLAQSLQQDVTIYWVVQADQEDSVLENLLSKYESLSSHISVVKKNPDVYPTFTQQYTSESVSNNSLIVVSGERSRYVSYNDIYLVDSDMYSYSYTTSFDGEGAITSAIDYVVTEDLPRMYVLMGHGEQDLPQTFADTVEKENIVTQSLSLLTSDEIPQDAACVLLYAPQSDLSETEAQMLTDYADEGGKLLVIAGPVDGQEFPNLHSVLNHYGITVQAGIVIENDRNHYAFGYPYLLMPDMESSEITDSLIESRYTPIFPVAQGLKISDSAPGVTSLLTTSTLSYSKLAGFALDTYEWEEGDAEGPFSIGVSMDTQGGGQVIWLAASDFLSDMYNAYSSGANVDLTMNALSTLMGQREAIAIRSKSLNYNYLTISASTAATLKFLMIGLFPLTYLGFGIAIFVTKRRKTQ